MNVLVTGASGFIGKNLVLALKRKPGLKVWEFDVDSSFEYLNQALSSAQIIFHLAGVNRPEQVEEFQKTNVGLTQRICDILKNLPRRPLLVLSSSTQAKSENPYGISKRQAEDTVLKLSENAGVPVIIFRLPGVFGKWCRPNYNSVVATLCHNIARNLPVNIDDPAKELELAYIDDVVGTFLSGLANLRQFKGSRFDTIKPIFRISLSKLRELILTFNENRKKGNLPNLSDLLVRRLYSTYLSYLPSNDFSYDLLLRQDNRGTLAELIKAGDYGQVFVSRTLPGITRGNHYHDSKTEKFIVLEGEAVIRLRNLVSGEKAAYSITSREPKVVDIPPGWVHAIENVGNSEMIVLFWASEVFDPALSDSYPEEA